MKIENLCIKCMKEKSSPNAVCEHCGFDSSKAVVPPHHLEPFVILAGKYLVGMAIGEGGFGITYIGMDLNLEMRVAIKEYYPNGCAIRDMSGNSSTVQSYMGEKQTFFEAGREKFINEARVLAKCAHLPEIVSVKDFFKENHTAYIVMEYIDGKTLKAYLKENGGRISVSETLRMMEPIIRSLGEVHKMNLIHRDISPDNIMIQKNGSIKVLDFGGARDFVSNGRSMSIMLKPGYAPEEQYRTHGEQGKWTDVYAICATMYRCITGHIPPEAMERCYQDQIKSFSDFQIDCPPNVEYAIFKGLSVYKNGRFQSMEELHEALYARPAAKVPTSQARTSHREKTQQEPPQKPVKSGGTSNHNLKIAIIALGCVLLLLVGAMELLFLTGEDKSSKQSSQTAEASAETDTQEEIQEEAQETQEEVKAEKKKASKAKETPAETPTETPIPAVYKIDWTHVQKLLTGRGANSTHALYVYDLQQNAGMGTDNCEQAMPASALITVPILYTTAVMIDNGALSMDSYIPFEYTYEGGRGNLTAAQNGQAVLVEEILRNMLMYSDNNAINTMINALSLDTINSVCNNAGFSSVKMERKIIRGSSSLNNYISAKDAAGIVRDLYNNTFQVINREYIVNTMRVVDNAGRLGIFQTNELYNNGFFCNQNGIVPDRTTGRYTEVGIVFADGKEYVVGSLAEGGYADGAAAEVSDACVYIHSCIKEG